mgnify:CR=1 FL=1
MGGLQELFTKLLGGTQINRKELPIKIHREFSDECGKYGEPKGLLIEGIVSGELKVSTRLHQWTLQKVHNAARGRVPEARGRFVNLEFCQ